MGNLISHKKDNDQYRRIYPIMNNVSTREKYVTNGIRTQKYNFLTFIPKNLYEQFHRFANIYFVLILILNFLPHIEAFGREVAPIPVVFVLAVTALKDAVEDCRRGQADRKVNESLCSVFNHVSNMYEFRQWQNVECGDLVEMHSNETVPADMVLLHSGDETGICHLETSNIDGESNLKMREVVALSDNEPFHPNMLSQKYLDVEPPNSEIYKFAGTIYRVGESSGIELRKSNLLLRGCTLRNTVRVIGIVVYTGKETKAMLNNSDTRFKRSKLERQINKDVIWCVLLLIVLCLSCAVGNYTWTVMYFSKEAIEFYKFPDSVSQLVTSAPMQAFLTFWTTVIYYQAMIPLPLYVTFELVKMHQVYHIRQDIEMYDEDANRGLEVRAFNIPEDLGQIQYVFCDKTGTLTENKMEFKRACICGVDYVDIIDPTKDVNGLNRDIPDSVNKERAVAMSDLVNSILANKDDGSEARADVTNHFFLLMAICNTTVISTNKNEKNPIIKTKKSDLRQKLKKRLHMSGEPVNLSLLSPKNLFTKTHVAPIRNINNDTTEKKDGDSDNKTMKLVNYRRRDSSTRLFEDVKIVITDESTPENNVEFRKVKSMPDFSKDVDYETLIRVTHLTVCNPQSPISSSHHSLLDDDNTDNSEGDPTAKCPFSDEVLLSSYESESPDEMALVKTACKYGYKLLQRGPGFVTIWNPESARAVTHKVLFVLPFDSNRKRMSIIIECAETREIVLYCKGADCAMFGRLAPTVSVNELNDTKDYLDVYSRKGLRTLVMALRIIDFDYFEDWEKRYKEIERRTSDDESERMAIMSEMERDMTLLGVSGIEDCLQEGVPDTIESLRKAGMTVWILTGDKRETAINIAYSAKLFNDHQRLITLTADTAEDAHNIIKEHLTKIETNYPHDIREIRQGRERPLIRQDLALCVDGETLSLVMCPGIKMDFLKLAEQCRSVVCARTTPMQKAEMVQLVKENLRMQTLAIGDGANDVSMIQTADVGIGISGKEGLQAVMASDFAMTKFKHLKRLLLVHGNWCYNKLARTALWMFYKDTIYILVIFWFQFYNAFSASVQMDQLSQILFNISMTGLPPIIYGIWDKDNLAETLMANPQLYIHGINCKSFKPWHFWLNILDSVWQSLVIFFICYVTCTSTDIGILEFGQLMTACVLITCFVHLGIETRFWSVFHAFGILFSVIVAYFVFSFIYNSICGPVVCPGENPSHLIFMNIQSLSFWLLCIVTPAAAVLPRLTVNVLKNSLHPNILTKAQIREKTLGRGKDLHFDYEPELVSVTKRPSLMNSTLRRPSKSDLSQISSEYGITQRSGTSISLDRKKSANRDDKVKTRGDSVTYRTSSDCNVEVSVIATQHRGLHSIHRDRVHRRCSSLSTAYVSTQF